MTQPIAGFRHFETHHCVTGSLRHIYAFNGHDMSEDLLLGLGEGVGFAYFRFKGQPPFLGGRAQPKPSMEEIAGTRTGVGLTVHGSSSDAASEKSLLQRLEAGEPVMVQVDMGYLPYFDFGGHEYHFGGHVVVACGADECSRTVVIADRDKDLHSIPLSALAAARGSRHKPFPPGRRWWDFDFSGFRLPTAKEVILSIHNQASLMLCPPIENIGVRGIRKAAREIARWDTLLAPDELRGALFNVWIFVSEVGGTGGGAFRRMFSRFLREASGIAGKPELEEQGDRFCSIANRWDSIADQCHALADSRAQASAPGLAEASGALMAVAEAEDAAWRKLREIAP